MRYALRGLIVINPNFNIELKIVIYVTNFMQSSQLERNYMNLHLILLDLHNLFEIELARLQILI